MIDTNVTKTKINLKLILFITTLLTAHAMDNKVQDEKEPEGFHRQANLPYCIENKCFKPNTKIKTYKAQGHASWYGRNFHGKKTSNGEKYNMFSLTAASPNLPIPSYAKITNLSNQKTIIVRINDRGPFVDNRLVDLSYAAAHKLDFIHKGVTKIQLEWIHPEKINDYFPTKISKLKKRNRRFNLSPSPIEHPLNEIINIDERDLHVINRTKIYLGKFKTKYSAQSFMQKVNKYFPDLKLINKNQKDYYHVVSEYMPDEKAKALIDNIKKIYTNAYLIN